MYQVFCHCNLDLISRKIRVGSTSPILFEEGIENLVYGCIFDGDMLRTILGHCDLISDLDSRIIVSGAYSLYYYR